MPYVEYRHNNSGGRWWLKRKHWKALAAAGWKVIPCDWEFVYDNGNHVYDADGTPKIEKTTRSMFASLYKEMGYRPYAYKLNCDDIKQAAAEWERIVGMSPLDAGCACCGQPHSFTAYSDDGKWIESGPNTSYSCEW